MSGNALKYSRDFSFLNVFRVVGDAVNVYIPCELVFADFQPIAENVVFGSRPYSVQSDIVAVTAHMGILFPSEKQKKSSPNFLFTCPRALSIKGNDASTHENMRRIDDDFRFYGVVVTVIAVEPLSIYNGIPRFSISSQTITDPGPFALDIVDYHFVTEFEPAPNLTDNPQRCMFHFDDVEDRFYTEPEEVGFLYTPAFFRQSASEILFRDFIITFLVGGVKYVFDSEKPNSLSIYKVEGEEKTLVQEGIQIGQIEFDEKTVSVAGNKLNPVSKVLLASKI